eukprot:Gb_23061 [translate_table: standard]
MGNEEASLSTVAVLTPPLSLDGVNMNCGEGQKQHNILSRVLNLFKSVRPGADLTRFQTCKFLDVSIETCQSPSCRFMESVYCSSQDLLSKCIEGGNEVERFKAVVAWSISTTRPTIFDKVPSNPILGETHHVSSGNLNVLLEQVSHHPPITALHATNDAQEIEMTCWQHPAPSFYGRSVEATVHGKRIVKLPAFGERYEMNCPKLSIRFVPSPSTEWVGIVTVQCQGVWIGGYIMTVMVMDIQSGKTSMLYDAKATITKLKTPIVQNPRGLAPTESSLVWSVVNECIVRKDWSGARQAKKW